MFAYGRRKKKEREQKAARKKISNRRCLCDEAWRKGRGFRPYTCDGGCYAWMRKNGYA